MALVFVAMIHPSPVHAQLVGSMEADIPFQFHAGDTKLPAGKYVIRMLDDSDLTIMEIQQAGWISRGAISGAFRRGQLHAPQE
jgi:hypothetical protein